MAEKQRSATFSPHGRWRNATLAPFAHRAFALFWLASLVSSVGTMVQMVGASWLMTRIGPSPDMVALVQTANALPFFFLSLWAGALADTRGCRSIMLASQLLSLLASIALAWVVLMGMATPMLLLALTFLISCGTAMTAPAWQASIGVLVPRPLVPSAVMANALGFNLARSIGPAIGGVIVATLGTGVAFAANAASYVGMIATLFWWRPARARSELPSESIGAAIAAGFRYVSLSPHLLSLLLRCLLHALPLVAVQALMPVVARDLLIAGVATYGMLLGGFGVGAMLAALFSASLRERYSSETVLRRLPWIGMLATLAAAHSHSMVLTLAAMVLSGGVWVTGLANFNIAVQLSSPRWVMGRVLAIYQTVALASVAVGSWLWGAVADGIGLRSALTVAAVVSLAPVALRRRTSVATEQRGSLDPRRVGEWTPGFEIPPSAGPIAVVIEYRVKRENAAEFLSVIHEIGRIRRRDGARSWMVGQDIDSLDRWTETFECPTWLDYLRWRTRPTESDQTLTERLRTLVVGTRRNVRRFVICPTGAQPLAMPNEGTTGDVQTRSWEPIG